MPESQTCDGEWTIDVGTTDNTHVLSLDGDSGHHELVFDTVFVDGSSIQLQRHGAKTADLEADGLPDSIVSALMEVA